MFLGCTSLTSLNLSNFNFSKVKTISKIFSGCANLEYINLNNFDKIKLSGNSFDYQEIFLNLPETIVICIKENDADSIFSQIKGNNCSVIDCTFDWQSKQNKIINKTGECIDSCDKGSQYKYEYNGKCYDNCEQGFLYDGNHNQTNECKCELQNCSLCPNVALKKELCSKCNIGYYPKENH